MATTSDYVSLVDIRLPLLPDTRPTDSKPIFNDINAIYNALRILAGAAQISKDEIESILEQIQAEIVTEAPEDGEYYVRRNGVWVVNPALMDAPSDGLLYGRQSGAWEEIVIPPPEPNLGEYEFLQKFVIADSVTTTVALSNLDLDAVGEYKIKVYVPAVPATLQTVSMQVNADATATNYRNTQFVSDFTSILFNEYNDPTILNLGESTSGVTSRCEIIVSKLPGQFTVAESKVRMMEYTPSNGLGQLTMGWIHEATANVTDLALIHSSTWPQGTVIKVYKSGEES